MWDNSVLGFTGKLICLRMEDCLSSVVRSLGEERFCWRESCCGEPSTASHEWDSFELERIS
jgi:hypothetical protein